MKRGFWRSKWSRQLEPEVGHCRKTARSARYDACMCPSEKYRYSLERSIQAKGPSVCFVMLNPSTADEIKNDPTIKRCIGFATRELGRRLLVLNLFAYRATSPKVLRAVDDPIGPENGRVWAHHVNELAIERDSVVVAAWGNDGEGRNAQEFKALCAAVGLQLRCLGFTRNRAPRHPLYVRRDAPLVPMAA